MEPKYSLPPSEQLAIATYTEQSLYFHTSVLILYFSLQLGLPNDFTPFSFPPKILSEFIITLCVLQALPKSFPTLDHPAVMSLGPCVLLNIVTLRTERKAFRERYVNVSSLTTQPHEGISGSYERCISSS
jgi:hypothetical protein